MSVEWTLRPGISGWQSGMSAGVLLLALAGFQPAEACGPDFPNWLLSEGDQAVLVAPQGDFAAELARMNLARPRVHAIAPKIPGAYSAQSLEADLADLRRALKQAGTPDPAATIVCSEHQRQRELINDWIDARRAWKESHPNEGGLSADSSQPAGPVFPSVMVVEGLPNEFADYFEGFIAWHNPAIPDKQAARTAWERLFARPEAQRRYRSTWAAFMLGKSWEETAPEKALTYFKEVRDLARQGYHDSLGLAAASLGLEAKVYLQQKNYRAAIETYLQQMAAGDPTATNSLATAAEKALASGSDLLRSLAKNLQTQKVITAFVISRPLDSALYSSTSADQTAGTEAVRSPTACWLQAAEEAEIRDMDSAEAWALAAYRADHMEQASRWIRRARNSPLTQWLQAKLLLRAGKLQSAATLLARIAPLFPIIHEGTNAPAPADRKDTLTVSGDAYAYWRTSAERQFHGELGVLQLSRGEYVEALDSLLNAGFWMDAAYVAERVLTLDELKNYVDRFWPAATADQEAQERKQWGASDVSPVLLREQIRYLLARRLTRESQGDQARDYYPAIWLSAFDQLMIGLSAGWDESAQPAERAAALFRAALITRTNGMELIGTEVAPDWHYDLGAYDYGVTGEDRGSNALAVVVRPSQDELRRNAQHHPDPNVRFQYRYQAALLAWEAAKLLPDNHDQTAFILWQGGCFLKSRDPQTADLFYKALVHRNRKTALGAEADRQRWFPQLDENGNLVPKKDKAPEPEQSPEVQEIEQSSPAAEPLLTVPVPSPVESAGIRGYEYAVRVGDSLASIARGFTTAGVPVTAESILLANPEIDPERIRVGQKILILAER